MFEVQVNAQFSGGVGKVVPVFGAGVSGEMVVHIQGEFFGDFRVVREGITGGSEEVACVVVVLCSHVNEVRVHLCGRQEFGSAYELPGEVGHGWAGDTLFVFGCGVYTLDGWGGPVEGVAGAFYAAVVPEGVQDEAAGGPDGEWEAFAGKSGGMAAGGFGGECGDAEECGIGVQKYFVGAFKGEPEDFAELTGHVFLFGIDEEAAAVGWSGYTFSGCVKCVDAFVDMF